VIVKPGSVAGSVLVTLLIPKGNAAIGARAIAFAMISSVGLVKKYEKSLGSKA